MAIQLFHSVASKYTHCRPSQIILPSPHCLSLSTAQEHLTPACKLHISSSSLYQQFHHFYINVHQVIIILFKHIRHTIQVTQTHVSVLFIVWLLRQTMLTRDSYSFHLLMQTFKKVSLTLGLSATFGLNAFAFGVFGVWRLRHLAFGVRSLPCSASSSLGLPRSSSFAPGVVCARCLSCLSPSISHKHLCHQVFLPFYYS